MKRPSYKIALLAYEGALSATLFAFRDLVLFANMIASATGKPAIKVDVVSAKGGQVTLAGGTNTDTRCASRLQFDALVIPGFVFSQAQDLKQLLVGFNNEALLIKRLHEKGTLIAANCVGTFLLGEAGLLDHRHVTTAWLFATKLSRYYPKANVDAQHILLKDGNVMTTGAFTSMHDLAIAFIREHLGEKVAQQTQNLTLSAGVGENQNKFIDASLQPAKTSPFIDKIQNCLQQNLKNRYSLEYLAELMSVTPRTLMRRYKQQTQSTPLAYLQAIRIQQAKQLLVHSDLSVERVAEEVGYQDVNGFRRVFLREVGERPSEFRKSMGTKHSL